MAEMVEHGVVNPVLNNLLASRSYGSPAVVDAAGNGKYTTISAAIAAAEKSIFVKNGAYSEAADFTLDGQSIIGESRHGVILTLTNSKIILKSSTVETAGNLTLTNNSKAVLGAGTTFNNISGSNLWLVVAGQTIPVASITDATNLVLEYEFQGTTLAAQSFSLFNADNAGSQISAMTIKHVINAVGTPSIIEVFGALNIVQNCNLVGVIQIAAANETLACINAPSIAAACIFKDNILTGGIANIAGKYHGCFFISNTLNHGNSYGIDLNNTVSHSNLFQGNHIFGTQIGFYSQHASSTHNRILDNRFEQINFIAIQITINAVEKIVIAGNVIHLTTDIGVSVETDKSIISNNVIHSATKIAIQIIGDNNSCCNNIVYDTQAGAPNDAIRIEGNENAISNCQSLNGSGDGIAIIGHRNTICNCQVHDNAASGIHSIGDNNTIIGNSVQTNTGTGIILDAGSDKNTVVGNVSLNNTAAQLTNNGANNDAAHNVIV